MLQSNFDKHYNTHTGWTIESLAVQACFGCAGRETGEAGVTQKFIWIYSDDSEIEMGCDELCGPTKDGV
jgi:hypothetical protein